MGAEGVNGMDKKEQARITRQQNKAAREARRAARDAEAKADKALVLDALRAVLQDTEATTAQRLFAVAVLDNVQHYSLVPYSVKYSGADSDAVIADFANRPEAYQEAENK